MTKRYTIEYDKTNKVIFGVKPRIFWGGPERVEEVYNAEAKVALQPLNVGVCAVKYLHYCRIRKSGLKQMHRIVQLLPQEINDIHV